MIIHLKDTNGFGFVTERVGSTQKLLCKTSLLQSLDPGHSENEAEDFLIQKNTERSKESWANFLNQDPHTGGLDYGWADLIVIVTKWACLK